MGGAYNSSEMCQCAVDVDWTDNGTENKFIFRHATLMRSYIIQGILG